MINVKKTKQGHELTYNDEVIAVLPEAPTKEELAQAEKALVDRDKRRAKIIRAQKAKADKAVKDAKAKEKEIEQAKQK